MSIFATIKKPTLFLNEEIARANIHSMVLRAKSANVRFRPHFKTHQSVEIGEWFREEGISSITVSSLDMAEYFSASGWKDILLAFPVNIRQLDDLDKLAARVHLELLIESLETINFLGLHLRHSVDLWIKIDTGSARTGIPWDHPDAVRAVVEKTLLFPHLKLKGLLTHAGFTYSASSPSQAVQRHQTATARLANLNLELSGPGCPPLLLSVGDTPGCSLLSEFAPADEIRPGNFIFFDTQQLKIGACTWNQIAVALVCPVVAIHTERSEAVIYGGAIHLSKDFTEVNGERQYGLICLPDGPAWGRPLHDAYVARLSQEHGILHIQPPELSCLRIGDLVCILPAHSCLTAQAMGSFVTMTGKKIEMMKVP